VRRRSVLNPVYAALLALGALGGPRMAHAAVGEAPSHTIAWDRYSFSIDGQRVWLWSAEFHYFRLPNPELWRDLLEKLKATGFNAVSLYFSWAYHSPAPGVYDFSGVRDIDRLLDIAREVGLYVLARPGPYINAELDSGGFPGWLSTQRGQARTRADDYQAAWEEWFDHVNAIIARHQLVDGGGSVVLFQIENEYDRGDAFYMQELAAAARADGIKVPIFHNDKKRDLLWSTGPGAPELYATDTYPAGFDCNRTTFPTLTDYRFLRAGVAQRPFFWGEFQGGAFDPWGGPGYERCRALTGPAFERMFYANNIENQFTAQNLYMVYGGTSWGWQADPAVVYTSYDYGAAFNEQRELTEKVSVLKQQAYLVASVRDLAETDDLGLQPGANRAIRVWVKENPRTRARFHFVRHADSSSSSNDVTPLAIEGPDGSYSTMVRVNGRDFKILVSGYDMLRQRLVYSTSEILAHVEVGDRDVAVLHGRQGEEGQTVLRYSAEPRVRVLAGDIRSRWDAQRGDLRLDYVHTGLGRVQISGGGRPSLELSIADGDAASSFWRVDSNAGPLIARGPYLVRSAERRGDSLWLRGDTDRPSPLEVFAPPGAARLYWNGQPVRGGEVPGPRRLTLPALSGWRYARDVPEVDPLFDDADWTRADRPRTNNPTQPATLPVLYADDYGFHYGDVWYRGRFSGDAAGIALSAGTGRAGIWSAWINGAHLGTVTTGTASDDQNSSGTFAFPKGLVQAKGTNVVSVLVRNMGHNENGGSNDAHKAPRGLLGASLDASDAPLAWRIRGAGERLTDVLRGPQNNGGLHGEHAGYALPGFADGGWKNVTLPHRDAAPGIAWYRATVRLDLPRDRDVTVGLRFSDDPSRHYRVLIFVNGWNMGQLINDVGPQRVFTLHRGILNHQGDNTLALAVWSADGKSGGLGDVALEVLGNYATAPP
jgi:beta-galactosidase GanA